jgi:hypothetical protein
MADVFISYKREDRAAAERLAGALTQLGFDVWWDFELLSGDAYRSVIKGIIDKCKVAVVLWSVRSAASDFVVDEASYAKSLGKLAPARIDDLNPLPFGFGGVHTDDLRGWTGQLSHEGFQRLLKAIEAKVGRAGQLGRSLDAAAAAGRAELEALKAAVLANTRPALDAFLRQYPNGQFRTIAAAQRATLVETPPPSSPWGEPRREEPVLKARPLPQSAPPAQSQAQPTLRKYGPWIAAGHAVVALVAFFLRGPQATEERFMPAAIEAPVDAAGEGAVDATGAVSASAVVEGAAAGAVEGAKELTAGPVVDGAALFEGAWTPYDLNLLHPRVRKAIAAARANGESAKKAASMGRANAEHAEAAAIRARRSEAGTKVFDSGSGQLYEGEWANGTRNGMGVLTLSEPDVAAGSRAAGGWREGDLHGHGVFSFAQNARNVLRYEGTSDIGVYYWRDGDRYAGGLRDGLLAGSGVYRFADGRRHEGAWANDMLNGYGVRWTADGQVSEAGIFENNKLITPLAP